MKRSVEETILFLQYSEKYKKVFGEGFPMIPFGEGKSNEEIYEMIDECIKQNKPVDEMGYMEYRDDVLY